MFYKTNFNHKGNGMRPPKQQQQIKVPQKLSVQAKLKIHQKMQQQKQLNVSQGLQSNISSTKYNKFYVNIQQIVDLNNPTVAWQAPPLIPITNERTRNLFIKKQSYLITNYYGSDYPRTFWIQAPGINGYLDNDGIITNRVACMNLVQISSNVDQSGQKFLDLLYSQEDQVTWTIPSGGLNLTFQIALDTNQVLNMPLSNAISINFQIRQIGI